MTNNDLIAEVTKEFIINHLMDLNCKDSLTRLRSKPTSELLRDLIGYAEKKGYDKARSQIYPYRVIKENTGDVKAELDEAITLLYEVIVGMRNSPVSRAIELLEKHGITVPENKESYVTIREERDNLRATLAEALASKSSSIYETCKKNPDENYIRINNDDEACRK